MKSNSFVIGGVILISMTIAGVLLSVIKNPSWIPVLLVLWALGASVSLCLLLFENARKHLEYKKLLHTTQKLTSTVTPGTWQDSTEFGIEKELIKKDLRLPKQAIMLEQETSSTPKKSVVTHTSGNLSTHACIT